MTINWGNILVEKRGNFDKKSSSDVMNYGPYDYNSIMHYDRCHWDNDCNRQTITRKVICLNNAILIESHTRTLVSQSGSGDMGLSSQMTWWDVKKLMHMYGCSGNPRA